MRLWISGALLLSLPVLALAQPSSPLSEAQQLRSLQYELNVCDMEARNTRKTLTTELRQALERAERAEQQLATAQQKAAAPDPPAPPVPPTSPDTPASEPK